MNRQAAEILVRLADKIQGNFRGEMKNGMLNDESCSNVHRKA
jgi:hypothetical protein